MASQQLELLDNCIDIMEIFQSRIWRILELLRREFQETTNLYFGVLIGMITTVQDMKDSVKCLLHEMKHPGLHLPSALTKEIEMTTLSMLAISCRLTPLFSLNQHEIIQNLADQDFLTLTVEVRERTNQIKSFKDFYKQLKKQEMLAAVQRVSSLLNSRTTTNNQ